MTTTTDHYRAAVAAIVAQAPPLSAETRAKLRSLLAPVTAPRPRQAKDASAANSGAHTPA